MRMTEYQCKHGNEWGEGCEECAVTNTLDGIEKATKEHELHAVTHTEGEDVYVGIGDDEEEAMRDLAGLLEDDGLKDGE